MIKNRVKDKINSMLEEVYEIVFYDCNSNRDIRIGALKSDDYKKYLPVAIKSSLSQKQFWFFLLEKLKHIALNFLFSFIMYLIVSISFIFYVTKLPISFDNLLKILTHNLYLFFMLLYCTTSLFYHLTMIARKSLLYINREITKLFLNNSIFNKTDYNYDNIYLIKKLKFK